jgi:3-oxoacyl-[acyl-carrier protein] reductase
MESSMSATLNRERFKHRIAIVTGAAGGIGRAISEDLVRGGAFVYMNDLSEEALEVAVAHVRRENHNVEGVIADVTQPEQVIHLCQQATSRTGAVDILVNNAGVLRSTLIESISATEWDLVLNANLKSAFLCSQAVLAQMKSRRYGKVVNMSSMAGRATSTLGGAHYTSAKAGLLGFSRHLAREAAPYGINVNAVCPGIVDTPMVQRTFTPDIAARVTASIPFGRLAAPADVAHLVTFLASDDASYITGAAVDIHGGELIIQ